MDALLGGAPRGAASQGGSNRHCPAGADGYRRLAKSSANPLILRIFIAPVGKFQIRKASRHFGAGAYVSRYRPLRDLLPYTGLTRSVLQPVFQISMPAPGWSGGIISGGLKWLQVP
jgi:hypothetical protein